MRPDGARRSAGHAPACPAGAPLDDLRAPMRGLRGCIEHVLIRGPGVLGRLRLRAAVLMVPILTPLRSPVETECPSFLTKQTVVLGIFQIVD